MIQTRSAIKLGRVWGIPIGLDWSWFLIFFLVTWSLATGLLPREYPELGVSAYWVLGIVTSLLFFGSVLVHELAHAWTALRSGLPVREINLHIFGGVAYLDKEARTPGVEFRVAIAGPISSLLLAAVFGGFYLVDQGISLLAAPSLWLARINLMLALFNMIPGFPLDGGRVLRAIIWRLTGNARRATRIAASTGQIVAFGFIAYGLYQVFTGAVLNGIWLVFIGWFLRNAAASYQVRSSLEDLLQGVTVDQAMTRGFPQISRHLRVEQLVNEQVMREGQRFFIVTDQPEGRPQGFLSVSDLRAIPRQAWHYTTVGEAMVPWSRVTRVDAKTDLLTAIQTLEESQITQLPVLGADDAAGRPVGTLSREDVQRFLLLRRELAA